MKILFLDRIFTKKIVKSLIDKFLYPALGPGQLWSKVACYIADNGGEIIYRHRVVGIESDSKNKTITSVNVRNEATGALKKVSADYILSSMPIQDLIRSFKPHAPKPVQETAEGLIYRDFITVGLLFKELVVKGKERDGCAKNLIPDNWLYIQEPGLKMGRMQIFNNWSPYLVANPEQVWLSCEYFCDKDGRIWKMSDDQIIAIAIKELQAIGFTRKEDYIEGVVVRQEKAYPAYFGTYESFPIIREFIDDYKNIFLIGRNGMHRYNNMDHSMMTAIAAVDNIINNTTEKSNIWDINMEETYSESKTSSVATLRYEQKIM